MNSVFCVQCRKPLELQDVFCKHCGADQRRTSYAQAAVPTQQMPVSVTPIQSSKRSGRSIAAVCLLLILLITFGGLIYGLKFVLPFLNERNLIGSWKGDGIRLTLNADHTGVTDRGYAGPNPMNWRVTSDGLYISDDFPWSDFMGHYFKYALEHNGQTLTLINDHGKVLAFERHGIAIPDPRLRIQGQHQGTVDSPSMPSAPPAGTDSSGGGMSLPSPPDSPSMPSAPRAGTDASGGGMSLPNPPS